MHIGESLRNEYSKHKEIACSSRFLSSSTLERFRFLTTCRKLLSKSKVSYVTDRVIDCYDKGVVCVMSQFEETLLLMQKEMKKKFAVVPVFQHFGLSTKTRFKNLLACKTKGQGVLLCSTSSCTHGVDMGFCRTALIIEPCYSAFENRQLIARLFRIGQRSNQQVYQFYYEETLEEVLLEGNTANLQQTS